MNDTGVAMVGFAARQLTLYDAMRRPSTLRDATRSVLRFAVHEAELRGAGDQSAAAGAAILLKTALIEVASVEVASIDGLLIKAGTLGRHRPVWAGDPLADTVVNAAMAADVAALTPPPRAWAQLERLLQESIR